MKEKLKAIQEKAMAAFQEAKEMKDIDDLKVKYLGKKGELTAILKEMAALLLICQYESSAFAQTISKIQSQAHHKEVNHNWITRKKTILTLTYKPAPPWTAPA